MNKQELIEEIEDLKDLKKLFGNNPNYLEIDKVIELIFKLDEPQPIKLKDVISRIKKLDLGTQKVWLNEILNELGNDYGVLKYKDGYEQGKLEGSTIPYEESQKVTVPQFVADWIEKNRGSLFGLNYDSVPSEIYDWVYEEEGNLKKLHLACAIGYTVEKEKQYLVKMRGISSNMCYLNRVGNKWIIAGIDEHTGMNIYTKHTRKELEEAGFGEVFNSPLFEVEEVEE